MKIICALLTFSIIYLVKFSADGQNEGHAIQIMAFKNRSLQIQLNEIQPILEAEDIKDRYLVVVSIAGPARQGKSFLMNFFIRFLNAQYKKHNVTDWLGKTTNSSKLSGFAWRKGRRPKTTGIWMWSEIFTHDFPSGDRVAIILLDTQGMFDDRSRLHVYTVTFALSMMLSSVQCYNLRMNNSWDIRDEDLQHLELFTEYGRLAFEQTNEKHFQKLLFIVRDWEKPQETPYGDAQKLVNETLTCKCEDTIEMNALKKRIAMSFDAISAFLMPYPGLNANFDHNFTGELQYIAPEFIEYLKQLVRMIFSPENLIVKRINGQKVRARDLIHFLQAYANMFEERDLPQPMTVLMATAEASHSIVSNDCLRFYSESMNKSIAGNEAYFTETELNNLHSNVKNESMAKFHRIPRLGDDELRASFQQKIESYTEQRFAEFYKQNERKRVDYIINANLLNERLSEEINGSVQRKMMEEIQNSSSELNHSYLNVMFQSAKESALQEFDSRKMGDSDFAKNSRERLKYDLNDLQHALSYVMNLYDHCLQQYSNSMWHSLNEIEYFDEDGFRILYQNSKNESIQRFQSQSGDNVLKTVVQHKVDANIEQKLAKFQQKNEEKRQRFLERANSHSQTVSTEIIVSFTNKMRSELDNSHMDGNQFIDLFLNSKQKALDEFASRKMGKDQLSIQSYQHFRRILEIELDSVMLKQMNELNKLPEEKTNEKFKKLKHFLKHLAETRDECKKVLKFAKKFF